jgi:hypothetical protein
MLRNTAMPTFNPVNAMPNPTLLAISAAVEADPHSRDILLFLLNKPNAMDSAKGIASWWVHGDEVAVQSSLNRLTACGAIVAHTLSSRTTLYGLTPDVDLRQQLKSILGGLVESQTSSKGRLR